ncbi:MAG: hypothetical protein PHN31_03635 [Candidatus Gracilibacteria bacterium]|nr:hypothetical protein [Candidatus Gracilibacteria bacterium]
MSNYKLQNSKGFLRWQNFRVFLKKIHSFGTITNSCVIMTINYNNSQNIINLLTYLSNESRKDDIDLLVIENSTSVLEKKKLIDYIKDNKISNITILETIENLGSAGAYALGLEYIFSNNSFEKVFIYEDDVLLLEKNTFSEMLNLSNNNNLVYINGPINTGCGKSWLVQIGLYGVDFLKKVGVPNPTYFTRSEDLDLKERFELIIKKYGYKEVVINKNYFHPYLKKYNGQVWWIYFSIRNHLYTNFKWLKIGSITYFINLFLYFWYGLSKLFIEKNGLILKSFFYAVIDYILGNYTFENNKKKLNFFKKISIDYPGNAIDSEYSLTQLNNITKNIYLISNSLLAKSDRQKIKFSTKLNSFFKNGCLIGGYFSPIYPIFMLSKCIISINEYDYINNKYLISTISNKPKYIEVFFSFLIALLLFITILFPLIFLRGIIVYLSNKLSNYG